MSRSSGGHSTREGIKRHLLVTYLPLLRKDAINVCIKTGKTAEPLDCKDELDKVTHQRLWEYLQVSLITRVLGLFTQLLLKSGIMGPTATKI